jgi:hypothetical protein
LNGMEWNGMKLKRCRLFYAWAMVKRWKTDETRRPALIIIQLLFGANQSEIAGLSMECDIICVRTATKIVSLVYRPARGAHLRSQSVAYVGRLRYASYGANPYQTKVCREWGSRAGQTGQAGVYAAFRIQVSYRYTHNRLHPVRKDRIAKPRISEKLLL